MFSHSLLIVSCYFLLTFVLLFAAFPNVNHFAAAITTVRWLTFPNVYQPDIVQAFENATGYRVNVTVAPQSDFK